MFKIWKKLDSIKRDLELLQSGLIGMAIELQEFEKTILDALKNNIPNDEEANKALQKKIEELKSSTKALESAVSTAEKTQTVTITNS